MSVSQKDEIVIIESQSMFANKQFTDVYCKSCGVKIAEIEYLLPPTLFKQKYGEHCLICGEPLGDSFRLRLVDI